VTKDKTNLAFFMKIRLIGVPAIRTFRLRQGFLLKLILDVHKQTGVFH
jgi:hypothetical protein